jgi:hypothetical protein
MKNIGEMQNLIQMLNVKAATALQRWAGLCRLGRSGTTGTGIIPYLRSKIFFEVPLFISLDFNNLSSLCFSSVVSSLLLLPLFLKKIWQLI